MYYLCYIRGINRNDTPYFSTKAKQEQYFTSKIVTQIEGVYPPHFKNTIRIMEEDLDFKSKVNYLILEFNDKNYYYFIDSISYINEGIMEISISMDTIQTYMFDIIYNECDVSRKSINRWNGNEINRDYIRENLSNGELLNYQYNEKSPKPYIFIKASKPYFDPQVTVTECTSLFINNITYIDGFSYLLLPIDFPSDITTIKFMKSSGVVASSMSTTAYNELIREIIQCPYTLDIKYVKYYNGVQVGTTYSNGECIVTYDENEVYCLKYNYVSPTPNDYYYLKFSKLRIYETYDTKYIEGREGTFIKNSFMGQLFKSKYVPQMIDENYIRYKYGERLGYTSYPLHKLKSDMVENYLTYDYINGNRIYYIKERNETNDKYLTTITNTTNESFGLITDAWNEYYSRNQGYLTTGVALAKQKAVVQMGVGLLKTGIGVATGGVGLAVAGGSGLSTIAQGGMSLYSIDKQLQVNKENLEFTPDTEKQGNYAITDIMNNSVTIFDSVDLVTDFEDVAFKLEKFGYKVNDYYNSINILNELNIRYYYNVVQCSNMNISLEILNDEQTIQHIIERFSIGLRLWNVENTNFTYIGDYTYDNVEKAYL